MAQDFSAAFYNSRAWRKQRKYILARDHYICTQPGCHRVATEVHHIIELNEQNINDMSICLGEQNLRSLCHDCHDAITKESHRKDSGILPKIAFDENGYPVAAE